MTANITRFLQLSHIHTTKYTKNCGAKFNTFSILQKHPVYHRILLLYNFNLAINAIKYNYRNFIELFSKLDFFFQEMLSKFWITCDLVSDAVFVLDIGVQLRTGYLEQGLMVYNYKKLAGHYLKSRAFLLDLAALTPLDILQIRIGVHPILRFPRFLKVGSFPRHHFFLMQVEKRITPDLSGRSLYNVAKLHFIYKNGRPQISLQIQLSSLPIRNPL